MQKPAILSSTVIAKRRILRNRNSVHPPNPPLLKVLVVLLLLLSFQSANSQVMVVPSLDSLESSLKVYYNQQWLAERERYTYEQKGKWLNYLPSIGITLGLPSVSYSSQTLYSYLDSKRARIAAISSIDRSYQLQYNDQLNYIRIQYQKLQVQADRLMLQEKALVTDRQIFAIHQEGYKKKEVKPLDYLQKRKQLEEVEGSMSINSQAYSIAVLELLQLAHYGISQEVLYFAQEDCIMLDSEAMTSVLK